MITTLNSNKETEAGSKLRLPREAGVARPDILAVAILIAAIWSASSGVWHFYRLMSPKEEATRPKSIETPRAATSSEVETFERGAEAFFGSSLKAGGAAPAATLPFAATPALRPEVQATKNPESDAPAWRSKWRDTQSPVQGP